MFDKQSNLNRLEANKTTVPKSAVPGMNTKTVGRVAPVEPVKQTATKTAAERASVERKTVEKTACERAEVEKTASIGDILGSDASRAFTNSVLGGLGGVVALSAGNYATSKINRMLSNSEYKKALDKAIDINPRLKQRNRAELEAYLGLIAEASPSVARNPLLLMNYLEYLIDHQGQINYTAYGDLVNLEGKILSNKANASPLTGQVQKAIIDSSVRGAFDLYSETEKQQIENRAHQKGFDAAHKRYGSPNP